jgi:hypothetical protein
MIFEGRRILSREDADRSEGVSLQWGAPLTMGFHDRKTGGWVFPAAGSARSRTIVYGNVEL